MGSLSFVIPITMLVIFTTAVSAASFAHLHHFYFAPANIRYQHGQGGITILPRRWYTKVDDTTEGIAILDEDSEDGSIKVNDEHKATLQNKATNDDQPSPLAGMPIGPVVLSNQHATTVITLRYIYEGGTLGQGRICHINSDDNKIVVSKIYQTLREDGVDLDTFYACAYASQEGGWVPLERAPRYKNSVSNNHENNDSATNSNNGDLITFPIPSKEDSAISKRIDIQLFRRPRIPMTESSSFENIDSELISRSSLPSLDDKSSTMVENSLDAIRAISASVPSGRLPKDHDGYFGIGIFQPKGSPNIGTLWRSAYQLGASVLYTIGGRYKASAADTLDVPTRLPLIQLENWNGFAEWASPKGAVWVAVEMGGTPLAEFEHPRNAIYILGNEDNGVPKSVVRACRDVVSLESERYGSYNVAVAGSLVLYDRMTKLKKKRDKGNLSESSGRNREKSQ